MTLRQRFGQALAYERRRQGLTQKQLAAKMMSLDEGPHVSRKHLSDLERGRANMTLDTAERAAAALNWNPMLDDVRLRRELAPVHHLMNFQIGLHQSLLEMTRPLARRFARILAPARPPRADATAPAPQRPVTRARDRGPTAPSAATARVVRHGEGHRRGAPRRRTPPDGHPGSPDRRARPSRKRR